MILALLGPESSGKTTLARELAQQFHGVYMPEYAREYMERLGTRAYSYDDVLAIARHQVEELRGISTCRGHASRPFFLDTDLIVTKVWFEVKYHTCPAFVEQALHDYPIDFYILCYPDIAWVDDPTRENGDQATREYLFSRYLAEIHRLSRPYYIHYHDK